MSPIALLSRVSQPLDHINKMQRQLTSLIPELLRRTKIRSRLLQRLFDSPLAGHALWPSGP